MPMGVEIRISFGPVELSYSPSESSVTGDQPAGPTGGDHHGASNMLRRRGDDARTWKLPRSGAHDWAGHNHAETPSSYAPIRGESVEQLARRIGDTSPQLTNEECVELARKVAGIHEGVRDWRRGTGVSSTRLPVGTPVATFLDRAGRPSSLYDGGQGVGAPGNNTTHAAVLMGYTDKGILVSEQYRGSGGPHVHEYLWNDPRGGEKAAENYFSINNLAGKPAGDRNPLNAPATAQSPAPSASQQQNGM